MLSISVSLTKPQAPRRQLGWLVWWTARELFGWWLSCVWLPWYILNSSLHALIVS